jgi:formylglycine-generating enzyme required for sulfatase activity
VGALGCEAEILPPLGHLVVFVDTDAPLPRADGTTPPLDEPQALFDRVRIDVFPGGATEPCDSCTEEFELSDERVREGASFVVRFEDASEPARVRARMYRFLVGVESPPAPETIVEVVAELPMQPEEGATEATLFLPTDTIGFPSGTLEAPIPVEEGRASRVGSWPPAARRGCLEPPRPGEVCVPGGAFWMGHPLSPSIDPTSVVRPPPRLVVVSPFYLDAHETTVAELRDAGMAPEFVWSGSREGTDILDWCTFSAGAAAQFESDSLPVNCIGWERARAYCVARGGDLPSEAQLEYASGALASRLYLWGLDPASCQDAVWGRAGVGFLYEYASGCRHVAADIGGPAAVGVESGRDQLTLPTGVVTDLAGNVSEWALDSYQPLEGACWVRPGTNVLVDPLCADSTTQKAVRGGSWGLDEIFLRATFRFRMDVPAADTGFRCARSAEPAAP